MIVVLGYYGYGNLGDEAILATLCTNLVELGISRDKIIVPSGNPQQTELTHGVKALARLDLAQLWQALGSARCLIVGGGSLLQDTTSKRSIPYYLGLVELALLRKVPVFMYAQGIGPIKTACYQAWVKRSFNLSTAYTVRDQNSAKFLAELGVQSEHGCLSADPLFQTTAKKFSQPSSRLLLNLRPYQLWPAQVQLWSEILVAWQKQGWDVEFIPLGPGDRELGLCLQTQVPKLKVHATLDLKTVPEIYEGAGFCVSMRLHGIIFAALQGVLPLGLNYDPKVHAVSDLLQIPLWELEKIEELATALAEICTHRVSYETNCTAALADLKQLAQGNLVKLAQVVGRC